MCGIVWCAFMCVTLCVCLFYHFTAKCHESWSMTRTLIGACIFMGQACLPVQRDLYNVPVEAVDHGNVSKYTKTQSPEGKGDILQ